MIAILQFFRSYQWLVYSILVIGLVFAIRGLIRALREKSASLYGLEREIAYRHLSQGVAAVTLIVFLAIAEFSLTVFLAPNLPAASMIATPTLNPLTTPVFTIPPELLGTIGLLTPVPTQTAQTTGCIPGQIMITSPKPGEVVSGQIQLTGTADIPNFGFYKYEFTPIGTDIWSTIQADRTVHQDSELGLWDTSELTPGDYNLRLVVLDNQGNAFPPCIVPVRITAPGG
jgi:hypothetical protein